MILSKKLAYQQKGLKGYSFSLQNKELEIYYVDVSQGHNTYIISKKCFHIYYILDGKGSFNINNKDNEVCKGALIEVPPNVEYTYSGKMKLLLIMNPPWFKGNDIIVKDNSKVR